MTQTAEGIGPRTRPIGEHHRPEVGPVAESRCQHESTLETCNGAMDVITNATATKRRQRTSAKPEQLVRDADRCRCLSAAIQIGDYALVDNYLRLGIGTRRLLPMTAAHGGASTSVTPLVYSILRCDVQDIKVLIADHTEDVNELVLGKPALFHALFKNSGIRVIKSLLSNGADCDVTDDVGDLAVFNAVRCHSEVFEEVLRHTGSAALRKCLQLKGWGRLMASNLEEARRVSKILRTYFSNGHISSSLVDTSCLFAFLASYWQWDKIEAEAVITDFLKFDIHLRGFCRIDKSNLRSRFAFLDFLISRGHNVELKLYQGFEDHLGPREGCTSIEVVYSGCEFHEIGLFVKYCASVGIWNFTPGFTDLSLRDERLLLLDVGVATLPSLGLVPAQGCAVQRLSDLCRIRFRNDLHRMDLNTQSHLNIIKRLELPKVVRTFLSYRDFDLT